MRVFANSKSKKLKRLFVTFAVYEETSMLTYINITYICAVYMSEIVPHSIFEKKKLRIKMKKQLKQMENMCKCYNSFIQVPTYYYIGWENLRECQHAVRLHRVFIEMFVSLSNIYLQSLFGRVLYPFYGMPRGNSI